MSESDSSEYELWLRSHFDAWSVTDKATLLIMLEASRASLSAVTRERDAALDEVKRLCAILETHAATMHPWYGPCDSLAENGRCAECLKVLGKRDAAMAVVEAARRAVSFKDKYARDGILLSTGTPTLRALSQALAALDATAPSTSNQSKEYFDVQPPGDDPKGLGGKG